MNCSCIQECICIPADTNFVSEPYEVTSRPEPLNTHINSFKFWPPHIQEEYQQKIKDGFSVCLNCFNRKYTDWLDRQEMKEDSNYINHWHILNNIHSLP